MSPKTRLQLKELITKFCDRDEQLTSDPYDIWKTPLGMKVKGLFNRSRALGFAPAAALTLYDLYVNNAARLGYQQQEYPIVRAQSALALLNIYQICNDKTLLARVEEHIDWLIRHHCRGYAGAGWGLGFDWAVDADFDYDANTPTATMTPYVLEAIVRHQELVDSGKYIAVISSIATFFLEDIKVMLDEDGTMATSYAPFYDRVVINACSYSMYCFVLCLPYVNDELKPILEERISKLAKFIMLQQRADGSFMYSPDSGSFIDCFHSCFVIKNLIKGKNRYPMQSLDEVIESGYKYIVKEFLDSDKGIYRRFTIENKPSLIAYDLYDNAEVINLMLLMGEEKKAEQLICNSLTCFVKREDIYSQIDRLGVKKGRNMLRWATVPFLYAVSHYLLHTSLKNQKG